MGFLIQAAVAVSRRLLLGREDGVVVEETENGLSDPLHLEVETGIRSHLGVCNTVFTVKENLKKTIEQILNIKMHTDIDTCDECRGMRDVLASSRWLGPQRVRVDIFLAQRHLHQIHHAATETATCTQLFIHLDSFTSSCFCLQKA